MKAYDPRYDIIDLPLAHAWPDEPATRVDWFRAAMLGATFLGLAFFWIIVAAGIWTACRLAFG